MEGDARSTATDSGAAASRALLSYSIPAKFERWVAQLGSRDGYATAEHASSSAAVHARD